MTIGLILLAFSMALDVFAGGLALGKRLGSRLGDVSHLLAGSVFIILGAFILVQTV